MRKTILILIMFISVEANATEWIEIDDASRLLWQMTANGVVRFRSLSEFDSSQDGCCCSNKLDTTTPGGKSVWSTILARIAAGKRITLGFPAGGSGSNPQTLSYVDRHAHGTNE